MDKQTASRLIADLLECQRNLDKALATAETLDVDAERTALVSALKNVIGDVLTEAIMPVVSQHPELNPYD
jgi:hypothetical protein